MEERKRKYKKALKKESRQGSKKNALWRTGSGFSTTSVGAISEDDGDDEGEEDDARARKVSSPDPIHNLLHSVPIP